MSKTPRSVIAGNAGAGGLAPDARPAPPWKVAKEAGEKAKAVTAALEALQQAGGACDVEETLKTETERLTKIASHPERPLVERMQGVRAYIERAEKRAAALDEEVLALQKEQQLQQADLTEHRNQLKELERQALQAAAPPTPAPPGESVASQLA